MINATKVQVCDTATWCNSGWEFDLLVTPLYVKAFDINLTFLLFALKIFVFTLDFKIFLKWYALALLFSIILMQHSFPDWIKGKKTSFKQLLY